MTQILLIRHAQSANNALPEHQRVCDPGLTDFGQEQARRTAEALRTWQLTRLYCSPFRRSADTLRPIAQAHPQLQVDIRADIFEQGGCYSGFGPDKSGESGMGREELESAYPGWEVDERISSRGWWGKPYESRLAAKQRSRDVAAWLEAVVVPRGGIQALVIHADFKRILLETLFSEALLLRVGPMYNTGITKLQWDAGSWRLDSLNSTTHLPSELVT